ncbi:MAG: hypothetical protein IPP37_07290 [Saprospiraceae bacterium]|nr:hypothetical protein [Saprospiraceae bacterium]
MRINILFISIFFLALASCAKDEEWQTVSLSGGYTNTPDLSAGFISVSTPAGPMQLPKSTL